MSKVLETLHLVQEMKKRKTMQERFSDGSGWKSPKEKYICDGGVWDTAVKMGGVSKDIKQRRKRTK